MANDTEIRPALTADEWNNLTLVNGRALVPILTGGPRSVLPEEQKHRIAALAMYGQPFGFTSDDVALLNWHAGMQHSVGLYINEDRLRSIADRIAALLPPN